MQMNDIIGEMQPSDYSSIGNSCCCGCGNLGGLGNGYGLGNVVIGNCGFGWWIWILLILFYTNQGTNNVGNNCCCCNTGSNDCCCQGNSNNGYGNGSCSGWLFLLVILFLCSGCNNGFGSGFGNFGLGNCGFGNSGICDGLDGLVGGCY